MPILLLHLALRLGWWDSTLSRIGLGWSWYCSCWKSIEIQKGGTPRRQPTKRSRASRSCFYQRYGVHCTGCDWRSPGGCGWSTPKYAGWGQINGNDKAAAAPMWTCPGQPADSWEILLKNGRGSGWNALECFRPFQKQSRSRALSASHGLKVES